MSAKLSFGSVIVVMLLGLYVYSVWDAVAFVISCSGTIPDSCATKALNYSPNMLWVLTTVGGLISALVIAELTATKPGELPDAITVATEAESKRFEASIKRITVLYMVIWLLAGLAAFVVGFMQHPKALQSLTDLGQSWIGTCLVAAYAYFGIKQPTT
jgi:hypothetical protein